MFRLGVLLLVVDFFDEAAGIVSVALPDVQAEFGVRYAAMALAAFTLPGLAAMLLEPPLLLWADRRPAWRRAFVVAGLGAMGMGLVGGALSTGPWTLAVATAVAWTASGLGVNLSRATLMDADPDRRELWMARWVLMGTLGDLVAPLVLAGLAWVGLGWRTGMASVGTALVAYAGLLATRSFPRVGPPEDDEEHVPWTEALRAAVANRRLLLWLFAVSTCGLLDEVFVAFGSAWLEQTYGADLSQRGLIFGLGIGGAVAGLAVQERLLAWGVRPERWLPLSSSACVLSLAFWLFAPSLAWSALWMVVLEFWAVQLYPLAMARAYRELPDRAAMVDAMAGLFAPVDLLLPLLMGLVADQVGLGPALALVALQPIVVIGSDLTNKQLQQLL